MNISLESFLIMLLIGGIAGWLASLVMKGRGLGILGNIVVGILGAFIGTFVLGMAGIAIGGSVLAAIVNAFIGAVILLFLIGLLKRA